MILLTLWLVAQTPPATPDSVTRVRFARALHTTSDSLDRLGRAIATFRTDLDPASPVLVMQRAGQVHAACGGAHKALSNLHAVLATPYSTKTATEQNVLRSSTSRLLGELSQCQRDWSTEPGSAQRADSLKAWGPYRSSHLAKQVTDFISDQRRFEKAAGLASHKS